LNFRLNLFQPSVVKYLEIFIYVSTSSKFFRKKLRYSKDQIKCTLKLYGK